MNVFRSQKILFRVQDAIAFTVHESKGPFRISGKRPYGVVRHCVGGSYPKRRGLIGPGLSQGAWTHFRSGPGRTGIIVKQPIRYPKPPLTACWNEGPSTLCDMPTP